MTHYRSTALGRWREELKRSPFHEVLRTRALDADPSLECCGHCARLSRRIRARRTRTRFTEGNRGVGRMARHAAIAVKIGKIAPTIDPRIDYLRASRGENLIPRSRLLKVGSMVDPQGHFIAVRRDSFGTHMRS